MLDARTRQVLNECFANIVKATIRREPGVQYVALPDAAVGWPIDDKAYEQFLSLVVSKSAFLARIDMVTGLDRLQGNILRDNITGHVLKRTNVDNVTIRKPTIVGTTTPELYNLLRAEWDWMISYDRIRQWAYKGPEFLSQRIANQIAQLYANDLLWVGFNGTSDGNPPAQADLSDFAIGWLQLLRAYAAGAQFMAEVVAGSGVITVGPQRVLAFEGAAVNMGGGVVGFPVTAHGRPAGSQIVIAGTVNYNGAHLVLPSSTANQVHAVEVDRAEDVTGKTATHTPDYASLDALAADLRNSIEAELRMDLVAIISDDLRATEEETIYGEVGRTPSEKIALQRAFSELAGLERVSPSLMPAGTMLITPPKNLAIYQHQLVQRRMRDEPERNGVSFYNDSQLDYIISDYRRAMAAENIAITK